MVNRKSTYVSTTEIWRAIPNLPGEYLASNLGRIKSIRQLKQGKLETIIQGYVMKNGYRGFNYKINGKQKLTTFHALIISAFLGPRPNGMVVNHKDHNKLNNNLSNLEYITQKRNCEEASKFGKIGKWKRSSKHRQNISKAMSGKPCSTRPLSKEQADEIRQLKPNHTLQKLSDMFGISRKAILNIIQNKSYTT